MKNTLGKAHVLVVPADTEFFKFGCKICRKILYDLKGRYLVGILIEENGKEFKYFSGMDPSPICCDEEKGIPIHFDTADEAQVEVERIIEYLKTNQCTKGLKLVSFVRLSDN